MKCNKCGTELPEASEFCFKCGFEIQEEPAESGSSDFNVSSMMLFALAFVLFFFSIVPMFLGSWDGMLLMIAGGVIVVVVAIVNLWASNKHEEREAEIRDRAAERREKARAEAMIRIKCRYCGALNERTALKCESCGATL